MSKEIIRSKQFATVSHAALNQDVLFELSAEQLREMQELYAGAVDQFKSGKLVTGKILKIDSDGVLVDIGYKSNGVIPRYEFSEHELKNLKVGDNLEVMLDELENSDGMVMLSYENAKSLKAWDTITKLFEKGEPVEGMVTHKVKGGLNVDIGVPAFLPGSQIDLQRVMDFDQFLGQNITANIIKINKKRGNVIISRRKYLADQRVGVRKKVLDVLQEGQILQGVVKNITNYGAFVDIGGVDGLLHITDMTWGRIAHPSEMVKIGDNVTVKVLSFDKDNEKISLGIKQLETNPWEKVSQELSVGSRVKGTVSRITDHLGLFVEVAKGVEGLVHISEISWVDRITDLHSRYKVGDAIQAVVVSLDKDKRRMSLSVKQLEKNPWESVKDQFKVGQRVKGTISNITDFGIFIHLLPGVDGRVHISDFSWTEHINHPSDLYKKGDAVEAVILAIDEQNKKISLGIKQLSQDPWENIEQEYTVGKIVDGEVSKTTSFGAFVRLPTGVEGLVHISELSDSNVEKVEDVLKVGDKRQFRVINVSKDDRKLGLSLRLNAEHSRRDEAGEQRAHKERGERKAAKQQQAQTAASTASAAPQPTAKPKSLLQLALEKHAARQEQEPAAAEEATAEAKAKKAKE